MRNWRRREGNSVCMPYAPFFVGAAHVGHAVATSGGKPLVGDDAREAVQHLLDISNMKVDRDEVKGESKFSRGMYDLCTVSTK